MHPPTSHCIGAITLGGEPVRIPHRVYFDEPHESLALSESERLVRACLFSRHHNGFVRARQVTWLLQAEAAWVVPYVVQLLGEYVVEIAEVIEAHLGGLSRHLYAEFCRENPSFVALAQTRAMSYWNCYYRFPWHDRHWRREEYPALRALAVMKSWT
jgi:hypothetical protein